MTVVIRDLLFYFVDKKLAAYNGIFCFQLNAPTFILIRNFNEYQKWHQEKLIMYMYMPMQT